MSQWRDSIPGHIQEFQAQQAQKELAKLTREQAALQRQQAADGQQNSAEIGKNLADLTSQVIQLAKSLAESQAELAASRPKIPEDKGGHVLPAENPLALTHHRVPCVPSLMLA